MFDIYEGHLAKLLNPNTNEPYQKSYTLSSGQIDTFTEMAISFSSEYDSIFNSVFRIYENQWFFVFNNKTMEEISPYIANAIVNICRNYIKVDKGSLNYVFTRVLILQNLYLEFPDGILKFEF